MMKHKIAILFVILFSVFAAFGQKNADGAPQFDMADFNKKFEVAKWLVEYDNVAWKTSDVVMQQDKKDLERLGADWFAFKDKNNVWHAVYGKLGEKGYELVFHFVMDKSEKITKSDAKLDTEFLDAHARALASGRAQLMGSIPEDSPRFNQYIMQNPDRTFSVWLLPAFQTDGVAVYGGEGIYLVDATGRKVLRDESYFQKGFRGFKASPPREIWLNYRELKKPTLGSIFFVWYYKQYFTKIFIDNESSTSTVVNDGTNNIWVHVEKELEYKPELRRQPGSKPGSARRGQ
ncbi:MAG: hypothetical protein AB7F88_04390 [Pyrinomonadaceae bacterium]